MNRLFGAGLALTAVFLATACEEAPPPPPPAAPPAITSFTASSTRIQSGETVTLSFTAEHADKVELVDQSGDLIELSGDASAGEATVEPTETRFFVLRASGPGGRDTAFVQVAVDEDLQEVFLIAVPPIIESGEVAQLVWSAFGARTAAIQTSTGQSFPLPAETDSGVLEVNPERTVSYTLIASGANSAETLTASAQLKVNPVLQSFQVTPAAANAGETLTITWTTRGASEVTLTEATFGELTRATFPGEAAAVNNGSFSWTIPETRPTGEPVEDGFPLRFTLTVKQINPAVELTRSIDSYVGDGPLIVEFVAPVAVTTGKEIPLSWRTHNVSRLQVLVDGGVVFEPLPSDTGRIEHGSLTLPAPAADTQVTLRVWSHEGGQTQQTRLVRVVAAPVIAMFNLPSSVNEVGNPGTASWTTQNATSVVLRVKHGPAVFRTGDMTQVSSGSANVYPGLRTTFVLEAYNDAGDFVSEERTIDVSLPATLTVDPTPVVQGSEVTVQWDLSSGALAQIIGVVAQPPLRNNPAIDFYELDMHVDANTVTFDDGNDGISRLAVDPSFSFSMAGSTHTEFWASTNGFIAFANVGAQPDNAPLDGTTALSNLLAPFWDDLDLGAGNVLYLVEGQTFPRRLIVQWNDVQIAGDTSTQLTFQVQLFETGEVHYGYKTLQGANAFGESASIGWRVNESLNHELGNGGAVLTEGDEIVWFTTALPQEQLVYTPSRGGVYSLFGRLQNGSWAIFSARLNVIPAGSVLVNEVMVQPSGSAPLGQWVELYNSTNERVDLSGTQLTSISTGTTWTIPEGTTVAARDFLVVGQSVDPLENGDAGVDVAWTDLTLNVAGGETLVLEANLPISQFEWTGADVIPNESVQAPERAIDAAGALVACTRTNAYNAAGSIGTPGAANELCFEYTVSPIPGAWEDISGVGTSLMGTSTSNQYFTWPLAVPFPYFGQTYPEISISSNGFITIGNALTSSYSFNATTPDPTPDGVVAPYWDNLYRQTSTAAGTPGALLAARMNGYTVIAWDNFRYSFSGNDQHLHFQVKLFDSGVIEFHYGVMDPSSSTSTTYVDSHTGRYATIWIERPDGSGALPIGINQPGTIQAHTAYRFVPHFSN